MAWTLKLGFIVTIDVLESTQGIGTQLPVTMLQWQPDGPVHKSHMYTRYNINLGSYWSQTY